MKQYFYADRACNAVSTQDDNCICWHDVGTGPFPSAREGESSSMLAGGAIELRWRDKPEPQEPELHSTATSKSDPGRLCLQVGHFYQDGWGNVVGPIRRRDDNEPTWWDCLGGTYTRDGTAAGNTAGLPSPDHAKLNLVAEVLIAPDPAFKGADGGEGERDRARLELKAVREMADDDATEWRELLRERDQHAAQAQQQLADARAKAIEECAREALRFVTPPDPYDPTKGTLLPQRIAEAIRRLLP